MSDNEILEYIRSNDDAALTAGEVADRFDVTRQGANDRLKALVEDGDLKRKKVGASAVVYWVPGQ